MQQNKLFPENKLIVVYDSNGKLMGVGKAESKSQAELLISEICEEWFEHCRGDVILSDNEWSLLVDDTMRNVSITIITGADDEVELNTIFFRDYTHYDL